MRCWDRSSYAWLAIRGGAGKEYEVLVQCPGCARAKGNDAKNDPVPAPVPGADRFGSLGRENGKESCRQDQPCAGSRKSDAGSAGWPCAWAVLAEHHGFLPAVQRTHAEPGGDD